MFNRFASLTALVLASSFATLAASQSAQARGFSKRSFAPAAPAVRTITARAPQLGLLRAVPGIRMGGDHNAVSGFTAQRGQDLGAQLTYGLVTPKLDPRDFLRATPSHRVIITVMPSPMFPTVLTIDRSKLFPVVAPSVVRLPSAPLADRGL